MENKRIIGKIDPDLIIWRYISLEKLVDLLESKTLYFSSLESLWKIDPFEGFFPSAALELLRKIHTEQIEEIEYTMSIVTKNLESKKNEINSLISMSKEKISEDIKKIIGSIAVNCWHINNHESEGMWKIYSEAGKGLAIRTKFSSLFNSLELKHNDGIISFGKVKYIDFLDNTLKPIDYMTEGKNLYTPLLKRISYEHEKEVRAIIRPPINTIKNENKSIRASIDPKTLIDNIYISPFAKESYISCVKTICKNYNIENNKIIVSQLLTNTDKIHKMF